MVIIFKCKFSKCTLHKLHNNIEMIQNATTLYEVKINTKREKIKQNML